MPNKKVAVIGECMLELSADSGAVTHNKLPINLSYGGDTLNTAVYLSRLGSEFGSQSTSQFGSQPTSQFEIDVEYFTALGDDFYSDWLLNQWQSEGVGCEYVQRVSGRLPGIYAIETDDIGERRFHYWRDQSPARELFDNAVTRKQLFQNLLEFDVVYLSGITLSLYKDSVLRSLFEQLQVFRGQGGRVVFDSNFRPNRWQSESYAKEIFDCAYNQTDIALPTLEDELALYPQHSKEQIVDRLLGLGVEEVVLKQGLEGCLIVSSDTRKQVPIDKVNKVLQAIDTTAAGDSFNAGYLASRLQGDSAEDSIAVGQNLAAKVIQYQGAIIPQEKMLNLVGIA